MFLAFVSVVAQTVLPPSSSVGWKTVQTPVGVSVDLPGDMRFWYDVPQFPPPRDGQAAKPPGCVVYSSHSGRYVVAVSQRSIAKDEDSRMPEAQRLDLVVLDKINMATSRFNLVKHFAHYGWPAVDLEIAPGNGSKVTLGGCSVDVTPEFGAVRYRVARTKFKDYVVEVWGQFTQAERQRIVDSLRFPQDVGSGAYAKWGPQPGLQRIPESSVEVWSPIEFKLSSSSKGADNTTELKSYTAEFGCEKLVVGILSLPPGGEDQLDDSFLAQVMQSTATEAEENRKVSMGEVRSYRVGDHTFHTAVGRTESADIRIDVAVVNSRILIFTIAVPHGMLDSDDIRHFIRSYSVP